MRPAVLLLALLAPAARADDTAWEARHDLTSADYQAFFTKMSQAGYRPTMVNGYATADGPRFVAVFEKRAGGGWAARHNLTADQYQQAFTQYAGEGYTLADVSGYTVNGEARFAGVWEKRGTASAGNHHLTSAQYQKAFADLSGKGFRPVRVVGYGTDAGARFAAAWEKTDGPAWSARHNMTPEQYQTRFDQMTADGYRPVSVSGYTDGGQERYAAVWEKRDGGEWSARHRMTSDQYQTATADMAAKGLRPVSVSGYSVGGQVRFAAVWAKDP